MIPDPAHEDAPAEPERCVIVINEHLPPGKACNAAAVVAFTLGLRHGHLLGPPFADADRLPHPGLIATGIPVLSAAPERLAQLRRQAGPFDIVDFPVQRQRTTDYRAFCDAVARVRNEELDLLAVGLVGPKKKLGKLVGSLPLFA